MTKCNLELGQVVATPGVLAALRDSGHDATDFLQRHAKGDWGDIEGCDVKSNEIGLREGDRIVSSYQTRRGETIWIITEADRSSTCLLLPSEY
jgi:hypothetical protein